MHHARHMRISFNAGERTQRAIQALRDYHDTDQANTLRMVICHSAVTLGLLPVCSEGNSEDT